MPDAPVLCLSIDLDDLRYYRGIHALPAVEETDLVFTRAVPRFVELLDGLGAKATFFAIAEDAGRWPAAGQCLRDLAAGGHEVASHSLTHPYDLSRRDDAAIAAEVAGSRALLESACGAPVLGFRGPGYNLTPALLRALAAAGYAYDSSVLPSPPYWAARAAVIGWMGLTGRRSSSITGRARDFFRGGTPFRWPDAEGGLPEVPMTAAGPLWMPLIGTTLAGRGALARQMVGAATRKPFVHVEFHAVDFLDLDRDGLEPGLRVEPALKVPLDARLEAYREHLHRLARGRRLLRAVDVPATP